MHTHGKQQRTYLVTLMDDQTQVHQIKVISPCCCDMWNYVQTLDLPITPAFMSIKELRTETV